MVSVKSPGMLLGLTCLFRWYLILLLFAGSVVLEIKRPALSLVCRIKETFPGGDSFSVLFYPDFPLTIKRPNKIATETSSESISLAKLRTING